MSDFHQFGPVTAIPRLVSRDAEEMEQRLKELAQRFPVSLVLPMVPAEMHRPALARIVDELCKVSWVDTLVISLNRAKAEDYRRALEYFERYPGRKVVLWSESPAVSAFVSDMAAAGLNTGEPGKGRACWLAIGLVLAEDRASYIAFQDADVVNYSRWMLGRLVLPAIEPTVDFDFVKAYYSRVSDRLHGRVTRLLLTPLLGAFTRLIGQDPYIGYLSSFRYALSGEFAIKCDLAEKLRLPCDWGLEIVTLFEVLRHRAPRRLCQVEIAERYDHKHQDLSERDPTQGLNRMSRDIMKHLLRTLAAAGVNLSPGLLMSLLAAFQRHAQDAVSDSYAVAVVNHLKYDRHGEEQSVHVFTEALRASIDEFLADPLGPPLVPNWSRVWAGVPDASARLLAAVERGEEPPVGFRR
ncbi:MAG: glycosyl transferase [Acidobacteriota bacterium]|jgi:glucosyl-3-phosphoglycerate synthase|nr:glycosyl transferase [Acidobacteriota bacterium]